MKLLYSCLGLVKTSHMGRPNTTGTKVLLACAISALFHAFQVELCEIERGIGWLDQTLLSVHAST